MSSCHATWATYHSISTLSPSPFLLPRKPEALWLAQNLLYPIYSLREFFQTDN